MSGFDMNSFATHWFNQAKYGYWALSWFKQPVRKLRMLGLLYWLCRQKTPVPAKAVRCWVMQTVLPEALRAKHCEFLAVAFEAGMRYEHMMQAEADVNRAIPASKGMLCDALVVALSYLTAREQRIVVRAVMGLEQSEVEAGARWLVCGGSN